MRYTRNMMKEDAGREDEGGGGGEDVRERCRNKGVTEEQDREVNNRGKNRVNGVKKG